MTINPVSYTQFARVQSSSAATPPQQSAVAPTNSRADLLRARDELVNLYDSLQRLADLLDIQTRFRFDLPDARSNPALGLDLTATAATLASSGEINASPMSFTPFGPDWTDGSTALLTIGGEYDGSNGDGNLTFETRQPGIRGINNLRLRVYDPLGNQISNINVRASDPIDTQYDLQNGLFVTVGDGLFLNQDTTTIQISTSTGEVFNPSLPFNGQRNDNPNFQYYDAPNALDPVVDGAFELNGQSIAVAASETLTDIVDRINSAGAGVTVTYNSATERVEFLQDSTGSQPGILIENDSSNLVAALKLDSANVVPGNDPENQQLLQDVALFDSVTNGNFSINNTAISVDRSGDSLDSIIERINTAGAGVTASFDSSSQQVIIESNDADSALDIDSNGTGLFAALNIPEGRVDAVASGSGVSRRRSYLIADELQAAFGGLNTLFQDGTFLDGKDHTGIFRNALASAIAEIFGKQGGSSEEIFGLRFNNSTTARQRGLFAGIERRDLTSDLQTRGGDVKRLLAGSRDRDGLIQALGNATVAALQNISTALGQPGTVINTFA